MDTPHDDEQKVAAGMKRIAEALATAFKDGLADGAPLATSSPDIAELAKALAAAQGKIKNAAKDSKNPHFNRSYADLASVWEACRGPLTENGLAIVQQPVSDEKRVGVVTTLVHQSGQWMRSTLWIVPERPGPQPLGSALTYGRRYSLAAFVGVAPDDDDDGEKAQGRDRDAKPPGASWGPKAAPKPAERKHDPADTGEPITPGTLEDLRFKATAKFPKGKAARDWLKSITGTDDAASLSEFEGQRALKVLEAAA